VLSRVLTIAYGVVAVALGLVIGRLGTVYEISMKVNWPFPALLLGVFLLGIFARRANAREPSWALPRALRPSAT